jgi:hypothetical protein
VERELREDRGNDAHHLLDSLSKSPSDSRSGACYDYSVVEENLKQTVGSNIAQ